MVREISAYAGCLSLKSSAIERYCYSFAIRRNLSILSTSSSLGSLIGDAAVLQELEFKLQVQHCQPTWAMVLPCTQARTDS